MLFRKIIFLVFACLCFSCYKDQSVANAILREKELSFQKEMELPPPNFSSPSFEDTKCYVEGLPEKVKWLTSKPLDLAAENTKVGGVLHLALNEYPKTFRYMGPNSDTSTKSLIWTAANLLSTNPETQEFMPYSATHWAFGADQRTVYFKLHENLKWSDGVPCTADDFIFAIEFMLSPYVNDRWYNSFAEQIEIKKINDYCFSIKNTTKIMLSPSALLDMVNIRPRPKHFYDGKITEDWITKYDQIPEPTTGPYEINLKESIPNKKLIFTRVSNWWARSYEHLKRTANIARLEYNVVDEKNPREKLFFERQIDLISIDSKLSWESSDRVEPVKQGYITKYVFNFVPLTGIKGICFNVESKLFKSKNIRFAMYYALDIQGMIDNPLKGEYIRYHNIGQGQIWTGINFNNPNIKKPDFNPEKAKELFKKEGYTFTDKDGILKNAKNERLSFELFYSPKSIASQLVYLKQKAKEAGVEIVLVYDSDYTTKVIKREYEAAGMEFLTWYFPELSQYFSYETKEDPDSLNIWNYGSPQMQELLDLNQRISSIERLAENNRKIEQLVHDEALVVPTYISNFRRVLAWKWVRFPYWGNRKNIALDLTPYGYMWVDEVIKIEMQKSMLSNKSIDKNEYHLSERYTK